MTDIAQETNTNCLKGLRCPRCGSWEPFYIECTGIQKVYDDDIDDAYYDPDWTDESQIVCAECRYEDIVAAFRFNKDGSPFTCGHQELGYCGGDHCCESAGCGQT